MQSVNGFSGRQVWEYSSEEKTDAEDSLADRLAVDKARAEFTKNRYEKRHSADLLMRLQFAKENPLPELPPQVQVSSCNELTEEAVTTTLRRGLRFYSTLQAHDGHWPGDYGGPLFLMPGLVCHMHTHTSSYGSHLLLLLSWIPSAVVDDQLHSSFVMKIFFLLQVITLSVTGALNNVLSQAHKDEMRRYLYNHQNKDGGWGLHIEGNSTMFGSVLNYVTLRLLGDSLEGGEFNSLERGRQWILDHGGATSIPSWGKFWLSASVH
jgi:cycloartenol synthase